MKYLFLIFTFLTFSFSAFAIEESDLNSEQKAVLYEIHAAIETEYPTIHIKPEDAEFNEEFNKAAQEFEMIIASVKLFAEKVKLPLNNFLETNLAKYIGTIVVFNFFEFALLARNLL